MKRKKSIKWNFVFQILTVILAFVNGIAFVPLYLKYIPNVLYGAWLASGNILNWITIIDPGISTILQQRIAGAFGKKDFDSIGDLISAGLILTSIISLVILIAGVILAFPLPSLINLQTDQYILTYAFLVAVIGTSLTIFSYSLFQINLGMLGSIGCGIVNVVSIILGIITTVLCILWGAGIWSFVAAIVIRALTANIGHGFLVYRIVKKYRLSLKYNYQSIKELFSLMTLTFASRLSGVLAGNVDAFFVARFLSPDAVPIYELTRKAPETSRTIIERPATSFLPALSHVIGENDIVKAKEIVSKVMMVLLWSATLIAGGMMTLDMQFVKLWIGEHYFAGIPMLTAICFSLFLTLVTAVLGNIVFAIGEIRMNTKIGILQSILSVIFGFIGVKYYGFTGLAAASGCAAICAGFWMYPITIFRKLNFSRPEIFFYLTQFVLLIVMVIILFYVFHPIAILTWKSLFIVSCGYTFSYGLLLSVLSSSFRSGIKIILIYLKIPGYDK